MVFFKMAFFKTLIFKMVVFQRFCRFKLRNGMKNFALSENLQEINYPLGLSFLLSDYGRKFVSYQSLMNLCLFEDKITLNSFEDSF